MPGMNCFCPIRSSGWVPQAVTWPWPSCRLRDMNKNEDLKATAAGLSGPQYEALMDTFRYGLGKPGPAFFALARRGLAQYVTLYTGGRKYLCLTREGQAVAEAVRDSILEREMPRRPEYRVHPATTAHDRITA